ncbi:MAG: PKD domain-containing protein [Bacteroidales bacterium]
MKKLTYILLLLTGCCLLFSGKTLAQFPVKELFVDTSKLDNYQSRKELKRDYLSIHEVNQMYYYDFDTTKIEHITGPQLYDGALGRLHYFENNKFLRYEIKDNQTLNSLLPGCRFFYEFADLNRERVIAQYNGKYYRYEDFNYLIREMGKGDMPQIAKIKALAQWRLWMFDKNVHVMSMDTVKYRVPGEKHIINGKRKSNIYEGDDYKTWYEGKIEIDGNTYDYNAIFLYDKRTIHEFGAYYKKGAINNSVGVVPVSLRCKNIYSTQDRSSNDIEILHDGNQVSPENQDGKSVFYYTNNSGNTQIRYTDVSDLGNQTKFRFYASTGPQASNISLVHTTTSMAVNTFVEYDLTGVLPSGMYLIKYLDQTGSWEFIDDVVLIPEDIDDSQTIFGTSYTLEIHYLEQSFDNAMATNDYLLHIKGCFNSVIENWFNEGIILVGDLIDNDGTVPLYVKFPLGEEKITYYNKDETASNAFFVPTTSNNAKFYFRSEYYNVMNNYSYQDIHQVLNVLTAHETFHWVTKSHSANLWNSSYSGKIKWINEGLSVMAQALAYPNLELASSNSKFASRANHFLSNPPTSNSLFNVDGNFTQFDEYAMGLFFYYLYSKDVTSPGQTIKSLIKNIDIYLNPASINNSDSYETGIKDLFDNTIHHHSEYQNINELLDDFFSVFLKKDFHPNILNYKADIFGTSSNLPSLQHDLTDLQTNYTSFSLYKKDITSNGNMQIDCQLEQPQGDYGNHHFAVILWNGSNNIVPNSFNEVFLSDENPNVSFNLQVHDGDQIMISKSLLTAPANINTVAEETTIDFTMDEELISNFSSDKQYVYENEYVQFQDLSAGNITNYTWSLEGGTPSTSNIANPDVVYNNTGTFDVSLTVENGNGDTDTKIISDYINVVNSSALTADFQADNTIVSTGDDVNFSDLSTGNIQSYQWSFEGGTPASSNAQNPSVVYNNPGTYDVSLTVTDATGSITKELLDYITVINPNSNELVCYASQPAGKTVDFEVTYSGNYNSTDELVYDIDYDDQYSDTENTFLSSVNFTHTYGNYGDYEPQASLSIYDANDNIVYTGGCTCPQINLTDPSPCDDLIADFSITPDPAPLDPQSNTVSVSFNNQSYGGMHPYHWHWSFFGDNYSNNGLVGGMAVETYNEESPWNDNGNPDNKTYTAEGEYPVTLTLMDNNGCTDDVTKYVQVFEPDDCINNLSINYGADLFYGDRLFVPWQENGHACNIPLRYRYFFNYGDNCYDCGNSEQYYEWFINDSSFYSDELDFNLGSGAENPYDSYEIEIHSQGELNQGINTVSVSLEGSDYDNDNYSCYDYASIEVIAINCDDFMNTGGFLALNSFINNPFFTSDDLYLDDYGYLSKHNNLLDFYSGDILLTGDANDVINNNDVKLTACNEVVLEDGFETGNGNFIAQTGFEIESCESISSKLISSDTASNKSSSINKASLKVFPNPVVERFKVKINHPKDGHALIQLFDTQGRLIKTIMDENKSSGCYAFEVRNFNVKPGMYFCKYTTNDISLSERIIKTQNHEY